jgi:hypothetical protein
VSLLDLGAIYVFILSLDRGKMFRESMTIASNYKKVMANPDDGNTEGVSFSEGRIFDVPRNSYSHRNGLDQSCPYLDLKAVKKLGNRILVSIHMSIPLGDGIHS